MSILHFTTGPSVVVPAYRSPETLRRLCLELDHHNAALVHGCPTSERQSRSRNVASRAIKRSPVGVQLFSLGILGEYVDRIHFRTMGKPPYAIRTHIADGGTGATEDI